MVRSLPKKIQRADRAQLQVNDDEQHAPSITNAVWRNRGLHRHPRYWVYGTATPWTETVRTGEQQEPLEHEKTARSVQQMVRRPTPFYLAPRSAKLIMARRLGPPREEGACEACTFSNPAVVPRRLAGASQGASSPCRTGVRRRPTRRRIPQTPQKQSTRCCRSSPSQHRRRVAPPAQLPGSPSGCGDDLRFATLHPGGRRNGGRLGTKPPCRSRSDSRPFGSPRITPVNHKSRL